ncbi:hypothetical protein QTP86_003405, partial [Hemibagrus guttatus]
TNFIPDRSRPGLTTTAIGAVDLQGAGGNWATVGRRSRGGRRVRRQREKRKGKSVGLRIGTLNVGTMTGKGRELADVMERRKVDILCVQETRWKGSKASSIGAGFKLFYYGVDSKRNGVGVVLKEEFVRNVLEVKRVSDRVMSLKLEIEGVMLNVVSGYAPQVGCELEEKERFWSALDEVMESIPTGERVVIGADFNGHVGEGNTGDEEVMGKFGVKERNLEGQMVVDFAKRMDMGVVNTYFQKREEHRVTYKSGGRRTQVDYILCRRGNLKEISDCKVVVGESVARQHRMVVCRMTLMVCKTKRSEIEKKTKWWKLKKEECCEEFRQKLRQALGGQVVLPDDWATTAEVIRETGRKVLGVSSGRRKEDKETWWWNEEVQDSIQRKRLAKKKWDMDRTEENRQEYKELQRRVKREVSKAKQKAYDELYTRLDTRGGEKDLYRLARQRDRDGKDVQQVRVIKDRDGRVLTSEESVQRRWKEYFEELMNEENEREKRVEGVNSVEQKVDKIRKDEVRKALKRMKSGKAVGPDDIPVEVWKCLGEAAVEFLANLFNRVLESERMPEEWRRSVLVPIFKNKGDVQSCSNYRGIKLMSHTMKVWERVVEARLRKVVEICEQQYGFMPRKSTTDAIFALRILMEKYRDGQRELHCVFVDLEKAYDPVPREELWYCMRKSGVAEKYVRVVQDMYERSRTVVRCAVGQTEEFNVEVGLHQGSALSPFLFAMVMDQLSEEVRQESPWTMMFADDIVICSESREQVEENLERWRFALERRGMKVSRSKTEYMCVNEREGSGTVRLQGEEVKKVQEFKYLGSTVQSNGECGKEVKKRVQAGWNGWRKVSGVLCDRKLSARIKGKVYRTVVRPAMLYGLETVSLRKRQESELEVAELKMLRFSLGVTRLDRIRNEYIRGTAHVGRLGDKVREARLRWFGHVQRRDRQSHVIFRYVLTSRTGSYLGLIPASMLEQARVEQREALSLARAVIDQQEAAQGAPSILYISRDRKLPEFSGCRSKPGESTLEEWTNSMKSAFKVMKVPEEDKIEFVKQYLKDEAKMTKFMLNGKEKSVDEIFDALNQTYGDKLPIGSRLKEFYDRKQMPVEEFKYLVVLFTSEGRMDCEIDRRIGAAAAVMRSMYRSVVVKKELSRKAKLSIYQSIYVPTLTYGHELWVMTERSDGFSHVTNSHRHKPGITGSKEETDFLQWHLMLCKIFVHSVVQKTGDRTEMILTDTGHDPESAAVNEFQKKFRLNLMKKFQCLNGVMINPGTQTLLNEIYTELYITEGDSGEVNNEHEVRQMEAASRRTTTEETPIKCNDIFKPLSEQDKPIRTVLTKGVAGIGKTVSVQKFILDWAEGKANQDVHLIFPLPFRELNLMKEQKLSLMELLHVYFKETKEREMSSLEKVLFIFDGLDECRFPLDFQNTVRVCDVTESASVQELLINLIKGNLLPSALIWITSRPAAADQIPSECVHRVTEVRGFNDPQKEEYFRKRISDQSLANNIITHLKSLRSLYIMCHIPVFCWISATVLERMLGEAESGEIPKTLTQMYTHFLIIQTNIIREKYSKKQESDEEMLLKLGHLAFQQLKKGNLIFYEEDLRECGIDVREAAVYSGVCTQIFREEFGLHQSKVYCFVHLSIQEHLAALYVHLNFMKEKRNVLKQNQVSKGRKNLYKKCPISEVHKSAVDQALESETGHLDLFLRFLLGLSLESNQKLLHALVTQTGSSSQSTEETVQYIKEKISEDLPTEKSFSLFHCLNELGDNSLVEEIQHYLKSGKQSELSSSQWSALVFVLLTSAQELEEFDLSKYFSTDKITETVVVKMMPVIAESRKAIMNFIPDRLRPGLTTTAIGAVDLQGAGGNWATVGRRSRGGRRVHRQREKRKGKNVGLRIGTLNVGTMTGKGRELADMMERRKVDILCVQETRWKGSKACSIGAGFKLFYYGVDSKRNGVGVVLKEEFVRNVLEVKRVSDRVMSLKLEIEGVMLNVVSGYAPQVGCELEEKERFWSELDELMESIPTGERVVIGADFNGHVGEGNTGDEEVMGKFGVKERNLEGQMVVDFAKRMDMGVVNTYFQKREEHRVTYKSGGRRTQKLRQALGGQVVLPDDWETTAEVIRETGRKVLGVSSGRRKEDKETWWWNEEVQDSIQRKRLAKKKWDMDRTEENRQEYKELQRRVKREVSKAKQKAYDELYTRFDTRDGEKDLYRLARRRDRDGKHVQQVRVIKDREGRVLTSEECVQRRWKEYFEELMNEENEREKE